MTVAWRGRYTAGRLLCDTYISAKDLVKQTTYTLKESVQPKKKHVLFYTARTLITLLV